MNRSYKCAVLVFLVCLILTSLSGCLDNADYSVNQFSWDMENKGHSFEISDVPRDFLPTEKKRMALQDDNIDIYIYANHEDMEKDAQRIDIGGCSYKTENSGINVNWISQPHFFKKGAIIVQYIGENETLVADLTDVLGEEFAGYGRIQEIYPPSGSK